MPIQIAFPIEQTIIFSLIFFSAIFIFVKINNKTDIFPVSTTNQLKGLAILAVVFGHLGYFLSSDTRFLYPLSTISGVGVDIFLFLSGYGLARSAAKKELSVIKFYRQRLAKLFIPLWLAVTAFFALDFLVLKKIYPAAEIAGSYLGFFPQADIYGNLDSPLWYFTLILFYYLIFPWLFSRQRPIISALLLLAASFLVLKINLPVDIDVYHLYQLHYLAFPLGVLFAAGFAKISFFKKFFPTELEKILSQFKRLKTLARWAALAGLIALTAYLGIHSGVGENTLAVQATSLIMVLGLVLIFIIKKLEFKILNLFGLYSYEIYLLHWPIMYRYDLFYKFLPAALATVLYLGLFVALGWLLKKANSFLIKKINFLR
ncbi:MAG: acyltransferase [Patescibacteria group bacterium]|jgi:peptidoglycan/LPS O-acetylase OafA/YrhL